MVDRLGGPGADQLREVLSWRIACELHRRLPARTVIRERHPGGGLYDCLSVQAIDESMSVRNVSINRAGSLFVEPGGQSWPDWCTRHLNEPESFVEEVGRSARFPTVSPLPSSTARTVVYRFIAELLAIGFSGPDLLQVRNGVLDTSGYGGSVREEWFEAMGLDNARLPMATSTEERPSDYWFVLRGDDVVAGLCESGTLYRNDCEPLDLWAMYQAERRIWPLIVAAVNGGGGPLVSWCG